MYTIAVANQKGGVGKTTTAVTLAHGLALRGRRVILIDLDSQGNVADSLGLAGGHELAEFLDPEREFDDAVHHIDGGRDKLHIIRSDKHTAPLKRKLAADPFGVQVLERRLRRLEQDCDVVILDCAPSVDLLHTAAMVAADWLLIPTRLDQLAVKGVVDALETLVSLQLIDRSQCEVAGILPTFYDRVTSESHDQLTHLAQTFGQLVMPPVPVDTKCREATRLGKTLWELDPKTRALAGVETGNGAIGGYSQVMDRLLAVTHGG